MALVQRFRQLCARDWEIRIKHVYREANVLADYIASIGHTLTIGSCEVGVQGNLLRHWAEHDMFRIACLYSIANRIANFSKKNKLTSTFLKNRDGDPLIQRCGITNLASLSRILVVTHIRSP
ncbi:hypothetical protein LINGRAPRIM_LOCUS1389 [Linum grandiflorum]